VANSAFLEKEAINKKAIKKAKIPLDRIFNPAIIHREKSSSDME